MAEAPNTTLCLINCDSAIYDITGQSTVSNSGVVISEDQKMFDSSVIYFDKNSNTSISISLPSGSAAKTISFWFYPTGSNTTSWYPTLFSTNCGSNASGGIYMHVDDGSSSTYPVYRVNDSTEQNNNGTYDTQVITRNAWHHFALCIDGTSYMFFVDGKKKATITGTNAVDITSVYLGALRSTSSFISGTYYSGYIDDILITSDCLYTEDFTVPTDPWWSMTVVDVPLSRQDTTSYGTYQGSIENLTDGDTSTYWWTNNAQSAGSFVQFSFNKYINFNGLTAITTDNTKDCIQSGTVLQTSVNGQDWTTVGNFTGATTTTFTDLNIKKIKYIRIYVETSSNQWLCVNEITLDYTEYYPLRIKANNSWINVKKVYQKLGNTWKNITDYNSLFSNGMIFKYINDNNKS